MTKRGRDILVQRTAGGGFGTILLIGGICCLIAGCGAEPYKRRLNDTVEYYAHVEKFDRNLGAYWPGTPKAPIKLRVPKQFELMPAPKPKPDPDEEGKTIPVPPEEDPRQPHYMRVILPGLQAAWQTSMEIVVGQQAKKVPAYMYLLSNRLMFRDRDSAKNADEFNVQVMNALAGSLKVEYPGRDEWEDVRFPAGEGYVEQKEFNYATPRPEQPINGTPTDVTIYQYMIEDIWVIVVFVNPPLESLDSRERLRERIAMCLETLTVSSQRPGRFSPSGGKKPAF